MNNQDKKAKVITWLFMGCLIGFSLLSLCLPVKGFSQTENRFLAKKPEFSWQSLVKGTYGVAYEAFLSDQFPGRDRWIGVKTYWERLMGKQDVNGVYFGADGYYIERFDREDLETEQLWSNLRYVEAFVQAQQEKLGDQRVFVMLVPSASQILTDWLPNFASAYDQSAVNTWLVEKLGSQGVLDMEQILKNHQNEEIYYKTDHHWTSLGAYYAYGAWISQAGMKPLDLQDFTVETASTNFYGTIQSKVNVSMKPDHIRLYHPMSPVSYQVYYDGATQGVDGLYTYSALQEKDQYKVFLDGNHPWTRIVNQTIAGAKGQPKGKGRKLLIIKDSFAHSLAPFAANHFEEVHMVDLRYFNQSIDGFMEQQGITDVLLLYQIPGFARERTLYKINP